MNNDKPRAQPQRAAKIDEVKVCQMLALLRERLGGDEIKPKLRLIQGGRKS